MCDAPRIAGCASAAAVVQFGQVAMFINEILSQAEDNNMFHPHFRM